MKYFIVKYRVSQSALDVLFGALKNAEHEDIEFLGCEPALNQQPKNARALGKHHWPSRKEYYGDVIGSMDYGKLYDPNVLAAAIKIKNKHKNTDQEMTHATKRTLIRHMVEEGKLAKNDRGQVSIP